MKIGAIFPQLEIGRDPDVIRSYARRVEEIGYDHLVLYEHVVGVDPNRPDWQGPYTIEDTFHEPLVLLGFLSAVTDSLELVTGILILPQRQSVLAAKQAAEVDMLSEGRLRMGLGLGWNKPEYEALGKSFSNRGQRIEEQVEILNRLWTQEKVSYEGSWEQIPDVGLTLLPEQQPIPIWMGGTADPVLKRIARMAQGWFPQGSPGPQLREQLETLEKYLEEEGRSMEDLGIEGRIRLKDYDPSEWVHQYESWKELGASHISINTMGMGFEDPIEHMQTLKDAMDRLK